MDASSGALIDLGRGTEQRLPLLEIAHDWHHEIPRFPTFILVAAEPSLEIHQCAVRPLIAGCGELLQE